MTDQPSSSAAGALLVLAGVVLIAQTLVGGLVDRILGTSGPINGPGGGVGGQAPTFDSGGNSVPGTGIAPGGGVGPGGTGVGTGNAPGYQPPGGYKQA